MADMYGTILSNTFTVKDVDKFKAWFSEYYFGYEIELFINEKERHVSFGSEEQYPSAYPRIRGADEVNDAELHCFSAELCEHLAEGEIFNVVAGGNEKLRYVSFTQLIIAQAHPDKPYYRCHSSDTDDEALLDMVLQDFELAQPALAPSQSVSINDVVEAEPANAESSDLARLTAFTNQ